MDFPIFQQYSNSQTQLVQLGTVVQVRGVQKVSAEGHTETSLRDLRQVPFMDSRGKSAPPHQRVDLLFLIDINHSELHFINKKGEELRNTIFGSPNEMEASKLIKLIFSLGLGTSCKGNFQRNIPSTSRTKTVSFE